MTAQIIILAEHRGRPRRSVVLWFDPLLPWRMWWAMWGVKL